MTLPSSHDYLTPVVELAFEKLSHDMTPCDGAAILAILDSLGALGR